MKFILLSLSLLFPPVLSCLLNATHCTCASTSPGGICLRLARFSPMLCTSYMCGAGAVCDCMGEHVCAISNCNKRIYRPVQRIRPDGLTRCVQSVAPNCIKIVGSASVFPTPSASVSVSSTPGVAVVPQMSATPSMSPPPSASPTPSTSTSPSMSVSATPSTSVTPTPSSSSSPTPSTSLTPTPSASFSPTPSTSLTPTPSVSQSPTPSVSLTPTPSVSLSPTPSVSLTPTPSLSMTPTPSTSLTPTPTSSTSPTPTPSQSTTPTPSTSPTPTPSTSTTPTPSPLPSPSPPPSIPVPLGAYCGPNTGPCISGTTCSCTNKCVKVTSLEIDFVGTESALLYACATPLGMSSNGRIAHVSYEGACTDLIVEVSHTEDLFSGMAMSIEHEGHLWSTGLGLKTFVQENPQPGYLGVGYDFSRWKEAVLAEQLQGRVYDVMKEDYGAMAVGSGESSQGKSVFRVELPFCRNDIWQL